MRTGYLRSIWNRYAPAWRDIAARLYFEAPQPVQTQETDPAVQHMLHEQNERPSQQDRGVIGECPSPVTTTDIQALIEKINAKVKKHRAYNRSASTAAIAAARNHRDIITAHAGDSRVCCFIFDANQQTFRGYDITADHINNREELTRGLGAFLVTDPTVREPHITKHDIGALEDYEHVFLCVMSDGVHARQSAEEMAAALNRSRHHAFPTAQWINTQLAEHAKPLFKQDKIRIDNMTIITVLMPREENAPQKMLAVFDGNGLYGDKISQIAANVTQEQFAKPHDLTQMTMPSIGMYPYF